MIVNRLPVTLTSIVFLTCSFPLLASPASAGDARWYDRFGFSVGGAYEVGMMENNGMGVPPRTMTAGSVQTLLSYEILTNWQVGVDFDFSVIRQLTSINHAGGVNERGNAWLLGVGSRYFLNDQLAIQGAIDFVGRHWFDHPTGASEPDHLASPLGFRVKVQWFAFSFLPNLSVDADVRYQRWTIFDVQGTEHSQATTQVFGGLGLTYHFGKP